MTFYLANIFIIMCYSIFLNLYATSQYGNVKKSNKIFMVMACIHLGLIMALRSVSVGTDTKLYSDLFEQISYADDIFNVIKSAPLYVVYNKAISLLFNNLQWIIVFNSLIIITGIGIFIYRNSPNVVMSIYYYITLYFYFNSFNISRQFIAIVLVANSYYYLKNNKTKKFILIIIAATLVHNTAIVSLILWPLKKIKWSNYKICLLAVVTTIAMFSYDKLLKVFLILFPRYLMYMGGGTFSLADTGQGKKILVSLFYLLIVVLCMIFLRYKKNSEFLLVKNELYFLTAILTIAVVIGIVFYNNLLISRIEIYFSLFIIIYIPLFIQYIGKPKVILYYCLMIITAIPMLVQLNDNISGVLPYKFFWIN